MGYRDKIKRIEEARNNDELPLISVLNNIPGGKAWVNGARTAKENQAGGDVKLRIGAQPYIHSFESQVSRKYKNFSYGKAKVTRFVGEDGGPCWVLLGCLDEASPGEHEGSTMFYCLIGSMTLNDILNDKSNPHVKLMSDKYYIIRPEAFIGVEKKWIGNTLDEVIRDWWLELSTSETI